MARIQSCTAAVVQSVTDRWECAQTRAGAAASPEALSGLDWFPAVVPGTFATALRLAGRWDGSAPLELDGEDVWYRTRFAGGCEEILRFNGLATIAEVWLNGRRLFQSESMFLPRHVPVRTEADNELHICFRSLAAWLRTQRGRARWRPRLASPPGLRFARTTLLGRMPGWCPTVHPVGPWRSVLRERRTAPAVEAVDARTAVFDSEGRMVVRAVLDRAPDADAVVEVGEHAARLTRTGAAEFSGTVRIPDVDRWWPHTHGTPRLYPARLRFGGTTCELGPVGFRDVQVRSGHDDGLALAVNGVPVFCRGACWTTPDVVALPGDADAYRPCLVAARDAGMNMIRVGGTMTYEDDAFFALCDELGLMVWQDAMLANFDYPATEAFRDLLTAELRHVVGRTQTNPSMVVLCGGSEVLQQAAMLGLPAEKIDASLYDSVIPAVVRDQRPDIVYVPNSPSGGDWPFQPDAGVAHYYGVGAYLRPLDDARRADVKFASECLALANVPDARTTDALGCSTITDPRWKRGVPRDPGAGWDFEDVRDHYLSVLFGVDPTQLRWADFARYLDLSRAVSCILIERVFAEWRRVGSRCAGGLVWQLQDVAAGAGWGVIDADGRPKPAWYALRRAFRTRQVVVTDEGLNGLHLHLLNETDEPLHGCLQLTTLRNGSHPVQHVERAVTVPPRGAQRFSSAALLPGFFDMTYAYRFGPRMHDVTTVTFTNPENSCVIAETVYFPSGLSAQYSMPTRDIGLEVEVGRNDTDWLLHVRSRQFAQFLHIDDDHFRPDDNWLHLPPGQSRTIRLRPIGNAAAVPTGEVTAINADRVVRYAGRT